MNELILSLVIPLVVFAPNVLMLAFPPRGIPLQSGDPRKALAFLTVLERVGQAGVFIIPLFYRADLGSGTRVYQLVMAVSLVLYYIGWARYLFAGRGFRLLFSPLLGIPVAMAISPVIYFVAAAGVLHSRPLFWAALILGGGHLPISYASFKATRG